MIELQQIYSGEWGLSVRAKLNTLFRDIIDGKDGINEIQEKLRSFADDIKSLSGVSDERYVELREQILKSFDYTDTSTADLLVYINGMNGGVSGFAIDTSFVPDFPLDKPVTVLAGQTGTYTHFLDENGNPITITQNGVTIFYRGANSTYWKYKTIPVEVNIQNELLDAIASLESIGAVVWSDYLMIIRDGKAYQSRISALPKAFRENTMPGNVIEDNSIPSGKFSEGAIMTGDIADSAITKDKLSDEVRYSINGEIDLSEISSYFENDVNLMLSVTSKTSCLYKVTITINSVKYVVGILSVFTDKGHHILTQLFETNYILNKNNSFSEHSDDTSYRYHREYNINSADSTIPKGSWSPWKLIFHSNLYEDYNTQFKELEKFIEDTNTRIDEYADFIESQKVVVKGILKVNENPSTDGVYLKRDDEGDIAVVVTKEGNAITIDEPETGILYLLNNKTRLIFNGTQVIPLGYHPFHIDGGKADSVFYDNYKCGKAATTIFKKLDSGNIFYHGI